MDLDANLEVMQANLPPPPGHERSAAAGDIPAEGLILEVQTPLKGNRDAAHRQRLADASVKSVAQRPDGLPSEAPYSMRRIISDGGPPSGAITEAVGNLGAHPASTIGKVTAHYNGSIRNCTGTVVAERVVLTAAHCLFSRGEPGKNNAAFANYITFEPQYSGDHGKGVWAGEKVYIHKGWWKPLKGSTPGPYDYGFMRLDAPIARVTGTASILAGSEGKGPFVSMGYPRVSTPEFKWDGRFLFATTGQRVFDGSAGTLKAENSLTEGSSGGPWFTGEEGGYAVAGLNSTKPIRGNEHTWSPEFGEGFQRLFARVLADMTGA